MGDMVERVKARLLPIIQDGIPGDVTDEAMAAALARAAIAALREPTEEMLAATKWPCDHNLDPRDGVVAEQWAAMIDAALGGKG